MWPVAFPKCAPRPPADNRKAMETPSTLDRTFVECSALGFQSIITAVLAVACFVLWRRQRSPHFRTWAAAWFVYVIRLSCMSAFLVSREMFWLFAHQVATGVSSLLLLAGALEMSQGFVLRRRHWAAGPVVVGWAWITIYWMDSMLVAGVTSTLLLSAVTIWTGALFWKSRRRAPSAASSVLAWTFLLWGVHHLDYPILRLFGGGALYGVFADSLFLFTIGLALLFAVLGDDRRAIAARNSELAQLTRLLLRAQEDERRRIARELHDEAGQILTAAKIGLDLDGQREASHMVGRALEQVRDLSNLLRPSVLDDLGLAPALRGLAEDTSRRVGIDVDLELTGLMTRLDPDIEVAIYRVVQEALTNVVRHARATGAWVRLSVEDSKVLLTVGDNGQGLLKEVSPRMGWLGMQERISALGGSLSICAGDPGLRLEATLPISEPS